MISLILIIIAAIANAIMDTLVHHYPISVFSKYYKTFKESFWFPDNSWKNKYVYKNTKNWRRFIPDSLSDGWHIMKTVMIFSLIGAVVCYDPIYFNWAYFIGYGIAWNVFFNVFYNHILIRR